MHPACGLVSSCWLTRPPLRSSFVCDLSFQIWQHGPNHCPVFRWIIEDVLEKALWRLTPETELNERDWCVIHGDGRPGFVAFYLSQLFRASFNFSLFSCFFLCIFVSQTQRPSQVMAGCRHLQRACLWVQSTRQQRDQKQRLAPGLETTPSGWWVWISLGVLFRVKSPGAHGVKMTHCKKYWSRQVSFM